MPPTHRTLLEEGTRRLAAASIEHPRREAEWLLVDVLSEARADVLGESSGRALLYARPQRAVAPEAVHTFRAHLRRRAAGEPLQYVLGHADFYGLRLAVTPAVLIPRPETEDVVEEALRRLAGVPQPTVLDVGTGSGCIALALKSECPRAEVHACDVSRDALAAACANADTCALDVHFFQADVLAEAFLDESPIGLDLLISNPPYVPDAEATALPEAVRDHEPPAALFSGDDPLRFYRVLAQRAPQLLVPGGHLVLETHAHHAEAVAALLREAGLEDVAVEKDTFGKERIATGRLG